MKKLVLSILAFVVLAGAIGWLVSTRQSGDKEQHKAAEAPTFDMLQHSLGQADSLWVIANKNRPLAPKDYTPADLVVPNVPLRLSKSTPEMQLRRDTASAL